LKAKTSSSNLSLSNFTTTEAETSLSNNLSNSKGRNFSMTTYIWYSGATDTTGKALVEALNVTGGTARPRNANIVIGWGTKVDSAVTFPPGTVVWNTPEKITANRDKLGALSMLKSTALTRNHVATFLTAGAVMTALTAATIVLPVIGRKKHHQGGAGFWFCPTRQHVQAAIDEGAEYFQSFINIKDEYRLHVGFGSVFHAVKKMKNTSEDSYRAVRMEKMKEWADKEGVDLSPAPIQTVIKQLCHIFYKEETLPNMLIRSNRRGWKFDTVANNNLPANLSTVAVNALNALGLHFGAVDCCVDYNNNIYILEVNTGPGLQGTALTKWVDIFRAKIAAAEQAQSAASRPVTARPATSAARPARAAGAVGAAEADEIDDGTAIRLVKAAETDEDIKNVLRMLRKRG
jgi:glutathione synthase/RimK-type ligase-like ATP-grasp enzyme